MNTYTYKISVMTDDGEPYEFEGVQQGKDFNEAFLLVHKIMMDKIYDLPYRSVREKIRMAGPDVPQDYR